MKKIAHVVMNDLRRLFVYPTIRTPKDFSIDYDMYWDVRGRKKMSETGENLSEWQRERAVIASRFIAKGSTVLDIGSGGGAVLEYLRDNLEIYPIGVDISKQALQSMEIKNIESLPLDISSSKDIAKLPKVDYIIGFEILEHVQNPEQLMYALFARARKGMIFSFPNTGYYAHRLRLLFGRFPLQWVVHPGEHVRFWTVADVRSWIPQLNLSLKFMTTYKGVPVLNKIFPSLFGQGILIVIEK